MSNDLNQRVAEYRKEVRMFWLQEASWIAVLGAVVIFGGAWFCARQYPQISAALDWRVQAAVVWVFGLIAPLKMLYPRRPTQEDVEHDEMLNAIGEKLRQQQRGN